MKPLQKLIAILIAASLTSCAADAAKSSNESVKAESQSLEQRAPVEYEETAGADEARNDAAPVEIATAAEPRAEMERPPAPTARQAPNRKARARSAVASPPRDIHGGAQYRENKGTEQYTDYGVNAMTKSSEDRLSTFSIDVDTGAYTVARKKLQNGQIPPAASVRVEEYVNYFRYDYPSHDRGAFGVHLEAAPSPFTAKDDTYLVRVGVQGKRISTAERKPVHLTFLVDVSGSMGAPDKLPLAQNSLRMLTNNLRENDTVALATYAGRVAKILPPTGMHHRGRILEAINHLHSGGGTGMNDGMKLAYEMAMQAHQPGHVNRVIVLSDGDANIGPSSHEQILDGIKSYVDEGVTMSTIGFGMGNYKDTMMEQLANRGNGNYYYIDSEKEARKVFGDQLDGTLQVIAKDVKIQVEFDPDAIPNYRLIGYENRDIADKDFRNDKVDAGEIGAGHTVTALYEVTVNPEAKGRLATVRVRHKQPQGFEAAEQEFYLRNGDVRSKLSDASKDFQFAAAVAGFAEILRDSPYAENLSLALVSEVAEGATSSRQADRKEFLELIEKARLLKGS